MKTLYRFLLGFILTLSITTVNAQWQTTGTTPATVTQTNPTHNVVVGPTPPTTTPTTSLYVNNATTTNGYSPTILTIDNNSNNNSGVTTRTSQLNFNTGGINNFKLYTSTGGSGCGGGGFHISQTSGPGIHLNGTYISFASSATGSTGCGDIFAYGKYVFDGTIGGTALNLGYKNTLIPPTGYTLTNSGASYFKDKVLIGTTSTTLPTSAYKLYVGGSIICEELVVKLQGSTDWADYVFAPNYKLMPLSQVKAFIANNSHLPGVPAACEIAETGVATGEMLTIQMKKIEELTLYLIQMEERIKELEAQNKALQIINGQ